MHRVSLNHKITRILIIHKSWTMEYECRFLAYDARADSLSTARGTSHEMALDKTSRNLKICFSVDRIDHDLRTALCHAEEGQPRIILWLMVHNLYAKIEYAAIQHRADLALSHGAMHAGCDKNRDLISFESCIHKCVYYRHQDPFFPLVRNRARIV